MGLQVEDVVQSFTDSEDENRKTYAVVAKKFDSSFQSHKNIIHKRYVFYSWAQKSDESINAFVTNLYKLAETCNFGQMKDEIRDKIIICVADGELSKKLHLIPDLTLAKAINLCRMYENVLAQQQVQHPTANVDYVRGNTTNCN